MAVACLRFVKRNRVPIAAKSREISHGRGQFRHPAPPRAKHRQGSRLLFAFKICVCTVVAVFATMPAAAQRGTPDCEATLRAWRIDRSAEMTRYMSTHTCTCEASNRMPTCVAKGQSGPQPDGGAGPGSNAAQYDPRAIIAARDEAYRRRMDEEFRRTKADLVNTLKTGRSTVASTPSPQPSPATDDVPLASDFLYALQMRTFEPMQSGGTPVDAIEPPPKDGVGLVGGTTWTFGFKRPRAKCDLKCYAEMTKRLSDEHERYCAQQSDPKACRDAGLPFTPGLYDFVISMASYATPLEDLASRVLFDGATYGEFSRTHAPLFASLKGRSFDRLDCHSNGAMLCLAALRGGDVKAKEVRLFGPQINGPAADIWREWAANAKVKLTVFIAVGDPIPVTSWIFSAPAPGVAKTDIPAWVANRIDDPELWAEAASAAIADSRVNVMGTILGDHGLNVVRFDCGKVPSMECHSMKLYEKRVREWEANKLPPIQKR